MQLVDSFMDYPLLLCKGQLFMMNSTNFQNCFLPNSVQSEGIRGSPGHTKLYLIYKCTVFALRVHVGLFMPFFRHYYSVRLFLSEPFSSPFFYHRDTSELQSEVLLLPIHVPSFIYHSQQPLQINYAHLSDILNDSFFL